MNAPSVPGGDADASAPAFNLLDEPWIPVRLASGEVTELGLLALFRRATEIQALAEPSPPSLIALYRLLLAVTHRALTLGLGSWRDKDRAHWYAQGLPTDVLTGYLERRRERFWLFHPEAPFMQVAALATAEETRHKLKPWTQVALESASGNNPVIFDHDVDIFPRAVPAIFVLRQLLGFLQFTAGGPVKALRGHDKDGPLCNSAAVMPVGRTLSQTLLLSLHPSTAAYVNDMPSWERPPLSIAQIRSQPTVATGPCDRYSRLTRSILLVRTQDGYLPTVKHVRFAEGNSLLEDNNAPDPMNAFRRTKSGLTCLTFVEGRAIWRDLAALLPEDPSKGAQQAASLEWAVNLHDAIGKWDAYIPVLVAGLASVPGQMKYLRARSEHYQLPASVLHWNDAAAVLRNQLVRCNELFRNVREIAADMFAKTMPDSERKDTKARARTLLDAGPLGPTYFSTAERGLPALLAAVGANDLDNADTLWSGVLLDASRSAWEAARRSLGASAAALRAEARTHGRFEFLLKDLKPALGNDRLTMESTA